MLTKEDKLIISAMSTTKMSARIKKQLEKLKSGLEMKTQHEIILEHAVGMVIDSDRKMAAYEELDKITDKDNTLCWSVGFLGEPIEFFGDYDQMSVRDVLQVIENHVYDYNRLLNSLKEAKAI